jgi:hypothetical protein
VQNAKLFQSENNQRVCKNNHLTFPYSSLEAQPHLQTAMKKPFENLNALQRHLNHYFIWIANAYIMCYNAFMPK